MHFCGMYFLMSKYIGFGVVVLIFVLIGFSIHSQRVVSLEQSGATDKASDKFSERFSRLYAVIRNDFMSENKSPYIIELDDRKDELLPILSKLSKETVLPPPDWRGYTKRRVFRQGETIKNELIRFASQERVHLIWTLPKDFVIKGNFEINGNFMGLATSIARNIDAEFVNPVKGWFCPKSNAIVITDEDNSLMPDDCLTRNRVGKV